MPQRARWRDCGDTTEQATYRNDADHLATLDNSDGIAARLHGQFDQGADIRFGRGAEQRATSTFGWLRVYSATGIMTECALTR